MTIDTISLTTARRMVLGQQGLWPGRRWSGLQGTEQAIRQIETVQVDTINVVARSHDLALWSRVNAYEPALLDKLMYQERLFFDFGTVLFVYPVEELPYWRAVMQSLHDSIYAHPDRLSETHEYVRQELRSRGPLGNRDFTARERIPGGFRTVKDTGKVLYWMWLGGEVVTHSRRGFERVFDFIENVHVPCNPCSIEEAKHFLTLKVMRELGLATASEWSKRWKTMLHSVSPLKEARQRLDGLVTSGELAQVRVEGRKDIYYLPAANLAHLETLEADQIPQAWQPLGPTSTEEVNFIAPLDSIIWDRTRALSIFEFEYLWEVYKPAHLRRWGYYTMPILWGDKLVGRINPKLDRKTKTLTIDGFWLEDDALAQNEAFRAAFQAGLNHFAQFHAATTSFEF